MKVFLENHAVRSKETALIFVLIFRHEIPTMSVAISTRNRCRWLESILKCQMSKSPFIWAPVLWPGLGHSKAPAQSLQPAKQGVLTASRAPKASGWVGGGPDTNQTGGSLWKWGTGTSAWRRGGKRHRKAHLSREPCRRNTGVQKAQGDGGSGHRGSRGKVTFGKRSPKWPKDACKAT